MPSPRIGGVYAHNQTPGLSFLRSAQDAFRDRLPEKNSPSPLPANRGVSGGGFPLVVRYPMAKWLAEFLPVALIPG